MDATVSLADWEVMVLACSLTFSSKIQIQMMLQASFQYSVMFCLLMADLVITIVTLKSLQFILTKAVILLIFVSECWRVHSNFPWTQWHCSIFFLIYSPTRSSKTLSLSSTSRFLSSPHASPVSSWSTHLHYHWLAFTEFSLFAHFS